MEAIESGKELDSVMIKKGLTGELVQELKDLLREHGIQPQQVPVERFRVFGNRNHQGVVAFISPIDFQPLEEIVSRTWEEGKSPFLVVLDSVTDVRNFGAIVRTAECAGAHAVIFPAKGSARVGSDAMKTSAGALNHLPISRVNNLKSALSYLKLSGIKVVAASEKSPISYTESNLKPPIAIVLGAEDVGVSDDVIRQADELVSIPLKGKVESLNVSVAAGILLFEVVR